jgi:hypothetical protein
MQLLRNDGLIRRRVRIASAGHLGALACFVAGLFLSNGNNPEHFPIVYGAMVLGLALYSVAQHQLRRWGPRYRFDRLIVQSLKGLDQRYTLGAFINAKLPDYIIVGPQGVSPVIARAQDGTIICRGDKWSREGGRFGMIGGLMSPGLGNPTQDVHKATVQVRQYLEQALGTEEAAAIPMAPLIVFLNQKVHLRIDGSSVPVTSTKELRAHLRKGKPVLNGRQIQRVVESLQASISP